MTALDVGAFCCMNAHAWKREGDSEHEPHESGVNEVLNLRVGEMVRVKNRQDILATLDQDGMLDCLPFMPELL